MHCSLQGHLKPQEPQFSVVRIGGLFGRVAASSPSSYTALRTLAEELPQPRVHLSAPASLPLHDANGALVVLRCAQEIATNAARHAQAQNLWLELSQQGTTLELRARDDGRGATELRPGNGLRGMRERLESAGGSLSVHTAPGEGFSLHARVPLRSDA